jgi:hypothetical protein
LIQPSNDWGALDLLPGSLGKVKAHELREAKDDAKLLKQLDDLRNELGQLRVSKVSGQGGASKLAKMYDFFFYPRN